MSDVIRPSVYPDPIELVSMGLNVTEEANYVLDRQNGFDDYLFELIKSPILLLDGSGVHRHSGGIFVVYAPGQPHYYKAEGELNHSWLQVSGAGIAYCINRYNIPLNQAIHLEHRCFLDAILEDIQRQSTLEHEFRGDCVTEAVRALFRNISRELCAQTTNEPTPFERDLRINLLSVRAKAYGDLTKRWSLDDLAALANMSRARFCMAYKSCFNSGAIGDLIDVRLRTADVLLRRLTVSIADVAQRSGFSSVSVFHLHYRKHHGDSPRVGTKSRTEQQNEEVVKLLYLQPVGHWSFDNDEEQIIDDLHKHPPAIQRGVVARTPGRRGGKCLRLDGGGYVSIEDPIVDTTQSYSVSVWVKHDCDGRMTAVSSGSHHHGAFYLQYITLSGGLQFAASRSPQDLYSTCAAANESSEHGIWYHLVGVHDANKQIICLYVNAKLAAKAAYSTPWRADGNTYLGCCYVRDSISDEWVGSIDDLRFYNHALSGDEVRVIYEEPVCD